MRCTPHSPSQLLLVTKLVMGLELASICQENICCLNTCISLFLFARRNGEMHALLQVSVWPELPWSCDTWQGVVASCPADVIAEWARVLRFWFLYYNGKKSVCSIHNMRHLSIIC